MEFAAPLVRGVLLRRYKRFLADIRLDDGTEVVAHCANPGAMLGVAPTGAEVWLAPARPGNKLAWSWQLVRLETGLVGISTALPNALAEEAIRARRIPELLDYDTLTREVNYGRNSRIDLLLESDGRPRCWVEVKNVHLSREPGWAEFPDCPTARGAKHLEELAARVSAGERAVMLYVVQRMDCDRFRLARDLDPGYARAFDAARIAGVEVVAYGCRVDRRGIAIESRLMMLA
jgi:sugar fermentation stimulation protein A